MENQEIYLISILIGMLVLLNIVATYIVFNTYFEIKERRKCQTLFIWLIPIIGAIIAIYINREDDFEEKYKKQIGNQTSITDSEATTHAVAAEHNDNH